MFVYESFLWKAKTLKSQFVRLCVFLSACLSVEKSVNCRIKYLPTVVVGQKKDSITENCHRPAGV
jgi:hypothetical protein